MQNNDSKIINAKEIAAQIKNEVAKEISEILSVNKRKPKLAVIIVGNVAASKVYVANKQKAAVTVGIDSITIELDENISEKELIENIDKLNNDSTTNGILVQLPLPKHINEFNVLLAIDPKKDVDCFHPYNVGLLSIGEAFLLPCTPAGIIEILKRCGRNIEISGKNCVVIGRSNIVGKPIASLLLKENGTVTICHSKTENLAEICRNADILVAAVGVPKFVKKNMVKENAVVIDVGIHKLDENSKKLCGDVDFDDCIDKVYAITPVPGGVGVMTIAMLMQNCLNAYKLQNKGDF